MTSPAVLAVLAAALALLPALAPAQDASVRTDTRLQMETTRRRLIVRPGAPARAPQLQYDVTSAIQARNLQRARRR